MYGYNIPRIGGVPSSLSLSLCLSRTEPLLCFVFFMEKQPSLSAIRFGISPIEFPFPPPLLSRAWNLFSSLRLSTLPRFVVSPMFSYFRGMELSWRRKLIWIESHFFFFFFFWNFLGRIICFLILFLPFLEG